MKKIILIMALLLIPSAFPSAFALGDIWKLHFSDGTSTINGTDFCTSSGACLSQAGGSYDLNIAGDSGSGAITNSETLTINGGTGITTSFTGNTMTITGASGSGSGNCSIDGSCNLITYDSELNYIGNCSGSSCDVTNTGTLDGYEAIALLDDTTIGNCSVGGSCSLITYDTELNYINNCSISNSCGLITYDSELNYIGNCSGGNCNIGWGNLTSMPAGFADGVDDTGSGSFNPDNSTLIKVNDKDVVNASWVNSTIDNRITTSFLRNLLDSIYQTIGSYVTNTFLDTNYYNKTQINGFNGSYGASQLNNQPGSYYLDNTDSQTLTYTPATDAISISGGNSIDITEVDTTINNCSISNSCGLITYDSELSYIGNCSGSSCDVTNTGTLDGYEAIALLDDTTVGNCSVSNSCGLITYDTELNYIDNCSISGSCNQIVYNNTQPTLSLTMPTDTTHTITDNSTCVIIKGDTAELHIC